MIQEVHAAVSSFFLLFPSDSWWSITLWNPESSNRIVRLRRAYVTEIGNDSTADREYALYLLQGTAPSGGSVLAPTNLRPYRRQNPISQILGANAADFGTATTILTVVPFGNAVGRIAGARIQTAAAMVSPGGAMELLRPDQPSIEIPSSMGLGILASRSGGTGSAYSSCTLTWAENVDEDR